MTSWLESPVYRVARLRRVAFSPRGEERDSSGTEEHEGRRFGHSRPVVVVGVVETFDEEFERSVGTYARIDLVDRNHHVGERRDENLEEAGVSKGLARPRITEVVNVTHKVRSEVYSS